MRRCLELTTLPPSCAVVMKSGNLNFLEPSGPLEACNGTALPLRLAMGQVFLLVLHCSSVSIISPLLHTNISFVYHRLWILAIESISRWNTSPSFRGCMFRPRGNLVISPQIELIVTTVLWYSESGFRARLGENFWKANSSVFQSVREWLVSSFASRVIWRCVEELST
jgi:hypothetical protein